MTNRSVPEGIFCPNPDCRHNEGANGDHIIKFGKTRRTVQRFRCKACGNTFTITQDTLFYRRRKSYKDILETLALLAEGVPIASLARAKQVKPGTIMAWLKEAAHHIHVVEQILLTDYQVTQAKIDGLWAYLIRHDRTKGMNKGDVLKVRRLIDSEQQP